MNFVLYEMRICIRTLAMLEAGLFLKSTRLKLGLILLTGHSVFLLHLSLPDFATDSSFGFSAPPVTSGLRYYVTRFFCSTCHFRPSQLTRHSGFLPYLSLPAFATDTPLGFSESPDTSGLRY